MSDTQRYCKDCGTPLTSENWFPSFAKRRNYICKPCFNSREKARPPKVKAKAATPVNWNVDGRATETQVDWLHGIVSRSLALHFEQHSREGTLPPIALIDRAIKFLDKTGTVEPRRDLKKGDRLAGLLSDYEEEDAEGNPATKATLDAATGGQHPLVKPDSSPTTTDRLAGLLEDYTEDGLE